MLWAIYHVTKVLQIDTVGRKTIFGYAFIAPKAEQCSEALRFLNVLLDEHIDDPALLEQARTYRMWQLCTPVLVENLYS